MFAELKLYMVAETINWHVKYKQASDLSISGFEVVFII